MKSGLGRESLCRAVAVAAAVAVVAAVFFLRRSGILYGWAALVFAIVLVVVMPSSAGLSRRILMNGAVLLGWVPLLWWVRLPAKLDRVGISLAVVTGALVCWVLWGHGVRGRARRLIPEFVAVDAMPVVGGALAAWTTWPLLASSDPVGALNLLYNSGWDHVAHLATVMQIRAQGVIVPMLGSAPDGSQWKLSNYPQHFHATIVALTELLKGPGVRGAATETLFYLRGLALIQVLTVVLLAAGVAQLVNLRRRPLLAWPVGAMVVGAFLFGYGAWALGYGFGNFLLACATSGLAVMLATAMSDELKAFPVFALGGLVVATVHGWTLLAPMAIVGAAVALVPLRRDRWPRTCLGWIRMIAALAATLAASAAVVPMLAGLGVNKTLTIVNDVLSGLTNLSFPILTVGMTLAVAMAAYLRKQTSGSVVIKGLSPAAVPLVGVLLAGGVALDQLVTMHQVSYYFDKLAAGIGLISVAALAAVVDFYFAAETPVETRSRKYVAVLASVLAAVAALQLFGLAGISYRDSAKGLIRSHAPATERVLQAVALTESRPFGATVYLAAMPDDRSSVLTYYWAVGPSRMWTSDTDNVANFLNGIAGASHGPLTIQQAADAARTLLADAPDRCILVAPEVLGPVRNLLAADLRSRVITWGTQ